MKDVKVLRALDKNTINNEVFAYKKNNPSQGDDIQSSASGMSWNDLLKVKGICENPLWLLFKENYLNRFHWIVYSDAYSNWIGVDKR